jgi:DNA (cytosine-5)-methyltransferase 1
MIKKASKKIKVAELFAGVGGFRVGFNRVKSNEGSFETVWSNQWEPGMKTQHASEVYVKRFGKENHSNEDIEKVLTKNIPEHDLLVGGFPCQDYSVARTLSHAAGLEGKKGVLWWSIHRILKEKGAAAPSFLMLENVDRLLKSPSMQRGRDFAVMLASLSDLGYAVEWRVINAAEYGMPQRRKRVYIMGYKKGTKIYKEKVADGGIKWLTTSGITAKVFPIQKPDSAKIKSFDIIGTLPEVTNNFNKNIKASPFETSGMMINRKVLTFKAIAKYDGELAKLKNFLEPNNKIPKEYFIDEDSLEAWKYLKGGKTKKRITKSGFEYDYSEGQMAFPDSLEKPSRTIVTGEGGSTPSRFKHVIKVGKKYRRLMPIELERLNMFDPNHTVEASDVKRAFFMGNALVVGVVTKLGEELIKRV